MFHLLLWRNILYDGVLFYENTRLKSLNGGVGSVGVSDILEYELSLSFKYENTEYWDVGHITIRPVGLLSI